MALFRAILSNSLGMSVGIVLLLLAEPWLQKRCRAAGRYWAWLVVLAGLLLPGRWWLPAQPLVTLRTPPRPAVASPVAPPSVTMPQPVAEVQLVAEPVLVKPAAMPGAEKPVKLTETADNLPTEPISTTPIAPVISRAPADPWQGALWVWLLGMVVSITWQAAQYQRFRRVARRWRQPPTERQTTLLNEQCAALGLRRAPPLWRCACVASPMLIGLLRPALLLPEQELDEEALRFVLRHELVHYRRRDLWVKGVTQAALALHWFNPLVYRLARALAADCEMACDEAVLAEADAAQRRRYGQTVLAVMRRGQRLRVPLTTAFFEGAKDVRIRFHSMLDMRHKRKGGAVLAVTLALCVLLGGALAFGEAAASDWFDTPKPALFHIAYEQTPFGEIRADYDLPVIINRRLSLAETYRLYDISYAYDLEGLRAKQAVPVGGGLERFSISVTPEEFAALMAAHGVQWYESQLTEAVKPSMPFLRLPERELTDEELLQYLALADVIDELVPRRRYAPEGALIDNRPLKRMERRQIFAKLEELAKAPFALRSRPLNDTGADDLYVTGYDTGQGWTIWHYPENRLLSEADVESVAATQAYDGASNYESRWGPVCAELEQAQLQLPEGMLTRAQAEELLRNKYGFAAETVRLLAAVYDEAGGAWLMTLEDAVPPGACRYRYEVGLDGHSGRLIFASQAFEDWSLWQNELAYDDYLLLHPALMSLTENFAPAGIETAGWQALAETDLGSGFYHESAAEVKRVHWLQQEPVEVKAAYEDGTSAALQYDPATGALRRYEHRAWAWWETAWQPTYDALSQRSALESFMEAWSGQDIEEMRLRTAPDWQQWQETGADSPTTALQALFGGRRPVAWTLAKNLAEGARSDTVTAELLAEIQVANQPTQAYRFLVQLRRLDGEWYVVPETLCEGEVQPNLHLSQGVRLNSSLSGNPRRAAMIGLRTLGYLDEMESALIERLPGLRTLVARLGGTIDEAKAQSLSQLTDDEAVLESVTWPEGSDAAFLQQLCWQVYWGWDARGYSIGSVANAPGSYFVIFTPPKAPLVKRTYRTYGGPEQDITETQSLIGTSAVPYLVETTNAGGKIERMIICCEVG